MTTKNEPIQAAAAKIRQSASTVALTGAGISVESGIPPFRGENGLWAKHDPRFIEVSYFYQHPLESWQKIKEVFYDFMGRAQPNAAHRALAELEKHGYLQAVITQNIDNLHQQAGSKTVYEYHGTIQYLVCTECGKRFPADEISLHRLPPKCPSCGGLLKPDFIFFSEAIPPAAAQASQRAASRAEVMLVIGTTGEVMPAAMLPYTAKQNGAAIIEVNVSPSNYTNQITDVFLQGKATEVMSALVNAVLGE